MYVAYYANGGNSPEIFGIRLYLIQEVSVLLFVGTCEAAIHIGLIPSNSGYNSVFENAGWNVAMADGDGNIVKTSGDMEGITSSEIMRSLKEPVPVRDGYVMKAVRNDEGITAWLTDISGIEKVSRELKAASIELEGENDIIQKESEIKLQRASIEAQNRLYDSVVPILKPQIDSIMKLLDEATDESLLRATVMCIYVKRRFNLFLVADGKEYINSVLKEQGEYLISKGFDVRTDRIGEPFEMMIDEEALPRVFDNLFLNIEKYADKGKPVTVECRLDTEEKKLTLIFTNTISLPEAKVESTGVGLMSVKRVMRYHGGQFRFENDKEIYRTYLTFDVTLPGQEM